MACQLKSSLTVLAMGSTLALGATPSGFSPASKSDLIVDYSVGAAMNGVVMPQAAVSSQPTIATKQALNGTSYAVIMVDLDIPTNNGSTSTFLHWMQTNLVQSSSTATLNTTNGLQTAHRLAVSASGNTSALVAYTPPSPPNKAPVSHRYTQILVDTSSATAADMAVLSSAAASRVGFSAASVLSRANLLGKVVAGNFYNVTNSAALASSGSSASNSTTGTTTAKASTTKAAGAKTTAGATAAAATTLASGAAGVAAATATAGAKSNTTTASNATASGVVTSAGELAVGTGLSSLLAGIAVSALMVLTL